MIAKACRIFTQELCEVTPEEPSPRRSACEVRGRWVRRSSWKLSVVVPEMSQCLETPNGVLMAHAGETMLAPEGWPMAIASLGTETRRAVVLVLHRSREPYVMPVGSPSDAPHAHWTSKGLCPK